MAIPGAIKSADHHCRPGPGRSVSAFSINASPQLTLTMGVGTASSSVTSAGLGFFGKDVVFPWFPQPAVAL